jgi:hypothetical protein
MKPPSKARGGTLPEAPITSIRMKRSVSFFARRRTGRVAPLTHVPGRALRPGKI